MGEQADYFLQEVFDEEDRRARDLPDDESINAQFDYQISSEDNVNSELEKLSIFLGGFYG